MKRIILLALVVLAATSCATTPPAPSNVNANANANTSASPSASPKAEANTVSADTITAREKEIWDKIKTKNPEAFSAMLADDFVYVTEDGVYDRAGTTDSIKQMALTDLSFADWKVVTLDKDAAVVTYTVTAKGTSGGQPIPATPMRASSLWANRGGKWVGVFHQDTAVMEPPPSDSSAKKTPPAAGPKSTEPPADDPVAREKQVWDAIKKGDYDRFASFLAEDQIEVFGWGVNDKAGSIEGIKNANLASGTLSDFKTIKVDDDAVVVTYVIKGGGDLPPTGSYGSTAWAKRDGKWLAVYHQDTTIKKK
jgi:hypothetical protein